MSGTSRKRVLFTGSARVHFVCALPVIRRLAADPRVEIRLTGGFRTGPKESASYRLDGFYDPFSVDPEWVIPVERAREEDFDVVLCSQLSPPLPRSSGRTVQVFHGVSFKNLSVRKKYLAYDFLCLPGPYHGRAYARNGLVRKPGQCLITGVPKLDPLATSEPDREAFLKRRQMDSRLPTILYAPTGSMHNSMETMGLKVVRAIGDAGKWNLLVKLHDHPKDTSIDWKKELAPLETNRMRVVSEEDVVPYLLIADLLLTDASSVSMEYTLRDRPIVFLDVPELFEDVKERQGALDLETHGRKVGVIVKAAEQVVEAIGDSLAHPAREGSLRRAAAADIFHDPGKASERVAGIVLHAAGLEPELPAGVEALNPPPEPTLSESE